MRRAAAMLLHGGGAAPHAAADARQRRAGSGAVRARCGAVALQGQRGRGAPAALRRCARSPSPRCRALLLPARGRRAGHCCGRALRATASASGPLQRPPSPEPRSAFNPLRFSARNELFVGRLAGLGLVCALIGERITGHGALAQLNFETGLPLWELEPAFLLIVCGLATTAVIPGDGSFEGPTAPAAPALGVRFTADRQRRLGRLAMLSFACALVAEAVTGQGPLDLLELDTGVPMDELEAGLIFFTLILGFGDAAGDTSAEALSGVSASGGASASAGDAAAAAPARPRPEVQPSAAFAFADEESLADEDEFDWNADDDEDTDD